MVGSWESGLPPNKMPLVDLRTCESRFQYRQKWMEKWHGQPHYSYSGDSEKSNNQTERTRCIDGSLVKSIESDSDIAGSWRSFMGSRS